MFGDGVPHASVVPGVGISVFRDALRPNETFNVAVGCRRAPRVFRDHGSRRPVFVSIGAKKIPVQRDADRVPIFREKVADAAAVPNNHKFVCINESDPLEASNAAKNAILFGGRRYRDMRPLIEKRHKTAIHIRLQNGAVVVLAQLLIEKEMINAGGHVVLDPFPEIAGFVANSAAERDASRASCVSGGAGNLATEQSEIGVEQALANINRVQQEKILLRRVSRNLK